MNEHFTKLPEFMAVLRGTEMTETLFLRWQIASRWQYKTFTMTRTGCGTAVSSPYTNTAIVALLFAASICQENHWGNVLMRETEIVTWHKYKYMSS